MENIDKNAIGYVVKLWIARGKNGDLRAFSDKPEKCFDCWCDGNVSVWLPAKFFPDIKWEDEEPSEVEITIKRNNYGEL